MPVYSFAAKFDGTDVATYGVVVAELPNNWDAPAVSYPAVQVPRFRAMRRTSSQRVYAPMDYVMKGNLIGTSSSDFESKRDALAAATFGDVAVIAGNQPTRQRTGTVNITYGGIYPNAQSAPITITLHCEDPVAVATSATTVTGASASDLACAIGTETSAPVVTVNNPSSPLVLTHKDHAGATLGTMTLTFAGSPSSIAADMLNEQIAADGVRHDEYLTAGDFITLSPSDAVYGGASATIRASSGSGSPAVSIVYTPAFR